LHVVGQSLFTSRLEQIYLDGTTDRLEREMVGTYPEGLFDLIAEGIKPEKRVSHNGNNEWRHEPYQVDEAKRQQEAIEVCGPVQQQGVCIRNRGSQNAFAPGLHRR
jgi:hypothetical protein